MKKLILLLLFIPLVSFGQNQPIKVEVTQKPTISQSLTEGLKAGAAVRNAAAAQQSAAAAAAIAKKDAITEILIPLKVDLYNYTHIAMVDMNHCYMGRSKKSYEWFEKEIFISSPLSTINPTSDRKKFKKTPLYLRNEKNPKWLYLYLTNSTGDRIDFYTSVILRDYNNKILYRANHVNVLLPQILEFLIIF